MQDCDIVGANMLQAKMATRKAKPNGLFWLKPCDVQSFVQDKSVSDLPGLYVLLFLHVIWCVKNVKIGLQNAFIQELFHLVVII